MIKSSSLQYLMDDINGVIVQTVAFIALVLVVAFPHFSLLCNGRARGLFSRNMFIVFVSVCILVFFSVVVVVQLN